MNRRELGESACGVASKTYRGGSSKREALETVSCNLGNSRFPWWLGRDRLSERMPLLEIYCFKTASFLNPRPWYCATGRRPAFIRFGEKRGPCMSSILLANWTAYGSWSPGIPFPRPFVLNHWKKASGKSFLGAASAVSHRVLFPTRYRFPHCVRNETDSASPFRQKAFRICPRHH